MFEYKVVPAPQRGLKGKGIKGTQARFANALQTVMNEHGAEGWEYQRTDTLPVEERQGLTGKTTSFQNMLVFRRALVSDATIEEENALEAVAPAESDKDTAVESETADARIDEALRDESIISRSNASHSESTATETEAVEPEATR